MTNTTFHHTRRPGFLLGFVDFFTAGLYLWGIPTAFIYTLVWMARIAEELKVKAIELGIEGPHTSWWNMFGWNTFGILLFGPAVATHRFFNTLNKIEQKLNNR